MRTCFVGNFQERPRLPHLRKSNESYCHFRVGGIKEFLNNLRGSSLLIRVYHFLITPLTSLYLVYFCLVRVMKGFSLMK